MGLYDLENVLDGFDIVSILAQNTQYTYAYDIKIIDSI